MRICTGNCVENIFWLEKVLPEEEMINFVEDMIIRTQALIDFVFFFCGHLLTRSTALFGTPTIFFSLYSERFEATRVFVNNSRRTSLAGLSACY